MSKNGAQMVLDRKQINSRLDKLEAELKKEEEARKKAEAEAGMAASRAEYVRDVSDKFDDWLENQKDRWIQTIIDTRQALANAEKYYDDVLTAQAKPSVFEAVLGGLIKSLALVVPELAPFALVLQLGVHGDGELRKKRQETVNGLKELSSEAFEKGKEAMEKAEQMEKDEKRHSLQIRFLEQKTEETSLVLDHVLCSYAMFKRSLAGETRASVTKAWYRQQTQWIKLVGGTISPYSPGTDEQLALTLLYEMLRVYCRQNVVLKMKFGPGWQVVPQAVAREKKWSGIEFDGLEKEKREKMYEYFEKIKRPGNGQPKIENWTDLLENWQFAS